MASYRMDERNIVILGKVGSGKRTLGNHICGIEVFHRGLDLADGGLAVHYHEQCREGTLYRVLIVDTESLLTSYNNPFPYIMEKFQTVHLIIFVTVYGRYTDKSHASLLRVVKSMDRAKFVSALVITHCEGLRDEARRAMIDGSNEVVSLVASFMGKGVHTVGFPDVSSLPSHMKPIFQNSITVDEKAIRELVESCDSPLKVEDLRPKLDLSLLPFQFQKTKKNHSGKDWTLPLLTTSDSSKD